jgi:hypothetical protein
MQVKATQYRSNTSSSIPDNDGQQSNTYNDVTNTLYSDNINVTGNISVSNISSTTNANVTNLKVSATSNLGRW